MHLRGKPSMWGKLQLARRFQPAAWSGTEVPRKLKLALFLLTPILAAAPVFHYQVAGDRPGS